MCSFLSDEGDIAAIWQWDMNRECEGMMWLRGVPWEGLGMRYGEGVVDVDEGDEKVVGGGKVNLDQRKKTHPGENHNDKMSNYMNSCEHAT